MENIVLRKLDFAPGIKAKDINNNFEAIHEWFRRERRHVGGYGLENGFDMSVDLGNFIVTISEGVMVNPDGEEIVVKEQAFNVGPPEYTIEKQKIICPEDGILKLRKPPYSPSKLGAYVYAPPASTERIPASEFNIFCEEENSRVYYLNVDRNEVYVSEPAHWAGKELTITYCSAKDRIDSILLHKDGTYYYARSILSTNPSHVNLEDCIKEERESYMLVGVVQWVIGQNISAYIYDNHRTFRRVYVDDENHLYLNGKLYRESQMIYIEKPEEPEPYDFWYDLDTNILYVYRQNGSIWEWIPVNDTSTSIIRESKMWTPETWPKWTMDGWDPTWPDWPFNAPRSTMTEKQILEYKEMERKKVKDQLFLFGEDEVNLNFVPGQNELIVIVDNNILMSDQFSEVISDKEDGQPEYMASGIGFKLKDPLDHPAYVQVIVSHSTRTKPAQETFQRAAIFVNEGFAIKDEENADNIFQTEYPYVVGTGQLEVWVNGVRLTPRSPGITEGNMVLVEMSDKFHDATDTELKEHRIASNYFRIQDYAVDPGSEVSWRINKYIWSYDQVSELIKSTTHDIAELQNSTKQLEEGMQNLSKNISGQLKDIEADLQELKDHQLPDDISNLIKDDSLSITQMDETVRSHLVNTPFHVLRTATNIINAFPGIKKSDFIQVHCLENDASHILIPDQDYTLKDTADGLQVIPSAEYIGMSQYQFFVTGFTLGA